MATADTIAAVATPPGRGGIGVVRVSGPASGAIATALAGRQPEPRVAALMTFRDAAGGPIDQGLVLYFPAPHSFTGEDVLELHGHGGPVVLDLLLARVIALGARLAQPGEFSKRAFLNGKLDLAQAEAVADLISASSAAAARGALASLAGEFSRHVAALGETVTRLRMHVEAAIDFPEEDVDFLADETLVRGLDGARADLAALLARTAHGVLLHDGMTVVLAGPPNAGKSSLLNALAGSDAAIVSATPGTTRDVLRERIHLDGMPLHVIDTAGLRAPEDEIEAEGIRRARAQMERAERVLIVVDDSAPDPRALQGALSHVPANLARTLVRNKIDLTGRVATLTDGAQGTEILLSARSGAGLDLLRAHLKECMGYRPAGEGEFSARRRHLDALRRVQAHLDAAADQLGRTRAGELAAEELRLAREALAEITGEFTSDDLLGRIFAEFCIGK